MSSVRRMSLVDQVRQGLLEDLMSGRLEPGAKLPNENEIGERFGVSRATVREAVLGLMEAGYLARRHGSGTFVTKAPRSRHALDTTVSYTEMIREAGHEPSVTLLGKTLRDPDAYEIDSFGLDAGEQVIELERVRFADRRPVIYSRDRIAAAVVRDVPEDAFHGSLYAALHSAGREVVRATAELHPTLADARLAELLEVKRGAPLLHIDQTDYDARGHAVMLSLEWHVADAFELIVNRRAS
ncbi:MAG TPA: GntR family transcriptional regulator [Solirubrobacter sp.]|nr:GntR family transcriptional regulator [Solirubrobacter sp.]